jgi:hypothetical protein
MLVELIFWHNARTWGGKCPGFIDSTNQELRSRRGAVKNDGERGFLLPSF